MDNQSFQDQINNLNESNPLPLIYQFGYTPEKIKEAIIDSFTPFFSNKTNLEENAILLTSIWITFLNQIKQNKKSLSYLKAIIQIYHNAKDTNASATFVTISDWTEEIAKSESEFWSILKSEIKNKKKLILEDFATEHFKLIGQCIEGLTKPYLKLLLQLKRISQNKPFTKNEILNLDLGKVVDELQTLNSISKLLTINKIKLSQWRNIAYHHNYAVENSALFCWYKKNGIEEKIRLSRSRLQHITKTIHSVFAFLKIADTVFVFDNLQDVQSATSKKPANIKIRQEAQFMDFSVGLSSQGFKILDLITEGKKSVLILEDLNDNSIPRDRAIHASQFLFNLWILTKSSKLVIEYRIFGGLPFLRSEINAQIFKSFNVEKDLSIMAGKVKHTILNNKFLNKIDPFSDWKLSDHLKHIQSIFYSQEGDEITAEEFARKFILSMFTNYMAFRSEGFDKGSIKMNIGSDGGMVIGNKNDKNILLQTPAVIKDSILQHQIIKYLELIIDHFEDGRLNNNIIDEARANNRFFFKKSLLKNQMLAK